MDFTNYLKTAAEEINQQIDTFFENWSKEVETVSPKLIALNNAFIRANEGGKRLRGALVKLGYEMVNQEPNQEIIKAAAAFEIFQTAILAHDDIIDLSALRRGKPTLYRALGGDHYGISQAICLGDVGFFLAGQSIIESNFSPEVKNRAFSSFVRTMVDTAMGEVLDVELPHRPDQPQEEDILTIFRLKTAQYTITGPLHLGAILAGASQEILDQIVCFGKSLGIAFQIQDDILGVFGNEKELGKSVTSDIEEGKNTLLLTYALGYGSDEQKKVLDKYYGKGKIGEEGLNEVKKVFTETGALQYSQQKALSLVAEAKEIISQMDIARDKKVLLNEMADFLVQRSR